MPVPLGDWCVWSARRPPTHPPTHGAAPGARRRDVDACSPEEEHNPSVTAPYCSVHRSCGDQSIWQAIQLFAAVCSNRKLIAENSQSVCSWT